MHVVCAHVGGPFGAFGTLFWVKNDLDIVGAVPRGAQQGFSQNWPTWAACSGLGCHIISILMGTMASVLPLALPRFLSPSLGLSINMHIMPPERQKFSAVFAQVLNLNIP